MTDTLPDPEMSTVNIGDARTRLEALVDDVVATGKPVALGTAGEPAAVVVSLDDYRRFATLREQDRVRRRDEAIARLVAMSEAHFAAPGAARRDTEIDPVERQRQRDEATAQLQALRDEIGNRNADLTESEIEEISVQAGREILDEMIDRLVAEGTIRFERDQRPGPRG